MSDAVKHVVAEATYGDRGQPGSGYRLGDVTVYRTVSGRWEIEVVLRWGSNQGYLEELDRVERRYRARSLDDLLRIAAVELREDGGIPEQDRSGLLQAVRDAIFEAEDRAEQT